MSGPKIELENRLSILREREGESRLQVEKLYGLLEKADQRRKGEPQNVSHWNSVLDNLESALDEARARLVSIQAEMGQLEKQLREVPAAAPSPASTGEVVLDAPDLPPGGDISLSNSGRDAAKQILDMSLSQIGALNLQEVSILHSQVTADISDPNSSHFGQLMGKLEYANQCPESQDGDLANDPEQRRQQALRNAIDKIGTNRLDELSEGEIRMVLTCHDLLTRKLKSTPREERLRRVLDAAVKVLRRRSRD